MKCKEALARLVALVDGELSPVSAERVREHLAECSVCAAAAEDTARIQELAAAWVTADSDVWEAVQARIGAPDIASLVVEFRALETEVRSLRAEVAMLRSAVLPTDPAAARLNSAGWPAAPISPMNLIGRNHPIAMAARSSTSGRSHPCLRIV